jgi:hypothetical protein
MRVGLQAGARFSASRFTPFPFWTQTMKNKKPNATQIWKHFEDFLVPRLRLSVTDRAKPGGILPILECAIRYFTTAAVPPDHCSTVPGALASLRT